MLHRLTSTVGFQVRPADRLEALTAELKASLEPRGLKLLGGLPQSPLLASTRLDEIQRSLQATQLQSHGRVDVGVDKVQCHPQPPNAYLQLPTHTV